MLINNKDNFKPIMAKMITGLGYENVELCKESGIDIKAVKDGKKYCFKCLFGMDAVGEKHIIEFTDALEKGKYDKAVFITNSSFASSAKKRGEAEGIELWDRNTIDRLYVGVSESLEDRVVEKKSSKTAVVVTIMLLVVLVALAAVWYFFFK